MRDTLPRWSLRLPRDQGFSTMEKNHEFTAKPSEPRTAMAAVTAFTDRYLSLTYVCNALLSAPTQDA